MIRALIVLTIIANSAMAYDNVPADRGAAGLARMLKRLQTTASVLHVVAHPDDEDGALLTYCARGLGVRTMLFSITRGEGGANLISSDFFDELGALRTLEHLKSAGYYGNELFYSRAADYGYSKNLDEANRKWNRGQVILGDLTEVVRRERPTVILSRFRGDENDGHGHHQMAGVISQQVFSTAANGDRYPDQIGKVLQPWQVRKLYTNNIRPQWRTEDAKLWTISIPTGTYDPLLGMSYAQLARYGLGFQRSQGISGHLSSGGERNSFYRLAKSTQPIDREKRESNLFEGIDTTVSGLAAWSAQTTDAFRAELRSIEQAVQEAVKSYNTKELSKCAPPLVEGLRSARRALKELDSGDLNPPARAALTQAIRRKILEFENAIQLSLAIEFECWAVDESDFQHATPGQEFDTKVRFVHRSDIPIHLRRLVLDAPREWRVGSATLGSDAVANNVPVEWSIAIKIGDDAKPTQQPWQRNSIDAPYYNVESERFRQQPLPSAPLIAELDFIVLDEVVRLRRSVETRFRHPQFGQVRRALTVVPTVSVAFTEEKGIMPANSSSYEVAVVVRGNRTEPVQGNVALTKVAGWKCVPESHSFRFEKQGEESRFAFQLSKESNVADDDVQFQANVSTDRLNSSLGFQTISARDLVHLNFFKSAKHRLRVVDLETPSVSRVGYIMGSGDTVPDALGMIGIQPELLLEDDLAKGDLSRFDVVIAGVRAYAVRSDLRTHNRRLLDYVEQGGLFIVQYQTPEFDKNFGPYPYSMGQRPEEVSEEDAEVTILEPDHAFFQRPNRISSTDFDGWVEQRGSKFLADWDERYTPLLECNDRNQAAQRGGMLIASYGKGHYVYSAYAWYRQLPQGVPGAYRLMSNLLSLGE